MEENARQQTDLKKYLAFIPLIGLVSGSLLWAGSLQPKVDANTERSKEAIQKTERIVNQFGDICIQLGTISEGVRNIDERMDKLEDIVIEEIRDKTR